MPSESKKSAKKGSQKTLSIEDLLPKDSVKALQKAYGDDVIHLGTSEHLRGGHGHLSSGIFPLDAALGGGWALGRIHTIFGPESSAKTYVTLSTIAATQAAGGQCVYIGSEHRFDQIQQMWARDVGVDLNTLVVTEADFGQKGLDVADLMVRCGQAQLVVVDSIAFLVPMKEIEESVSSNQVGEHARMMGRGVRKILSGLVREHENPPTMIFTNQIRFKVGVMFGNPETLSGGQAPRFAASTEVRMRKVKNRDGKLSSCEFGVEPVEGEGKVLISAQCGFRVAKNKTWDPGGEGEFEIMFRNTPRKQRGRVIDEPSIILAARRFDLLKKVGGGWECLGRTFKKKEEVTETLQLDRDFRASLTDVLLTEIVQV